MAFNEGPKLSVHFQQGAGRQMFQTVCLLCCFANANCPSRVGSANSKLEGCTFEEVVQSTSPTMKGDVNWVQCKFTNYRCTNTKTFGIAMLQRVSVTCIHCIFEGCEGVGSPTLFFEAPSDDYTSKAIMEACEVTRCKTTKAAGSVGSLGVSLGALYFEAKRSYDDPKNPIHVELTNCNFRENSQGGLVAGGYGIELVVRGGVFTDNLKETERTLGGAISLFYPLRVTLEGIQLFSSHSVEGQCICLDERAPKVVLALVIADCSFHVQPGASAAARVLATGGSTLCFMSGAQEFTLENCSFYGEGVHIAAADGVALTVKVTDCVKFDGGQDIVAPNVTFNPEELVWFNGEPCGGWPASDPVGPDESGGSGGPDPEGPGDDSGNKGGNKLGGGEIAAIVIVLLIVIAVVAVLLFFFVFRRRYGRGSDSHSGEATSEVTTTEETVTGTEAVGGQSPESDGKGKHDSE